MGVPRLQSSIYCDARIPDWRRGGGEWSKSQGDCRSAQRNPNAKPQRAEGGHKSTKIFCVTDSWRFPVVSLPSKQRTKSFENMEQIKYSLRLAGFFVCLFFNLFLFLSLSLFLDWTLESIHLPGGHLQGALPRSYSPPRQGASPSVCPVACHHDHHTTL